jgi:hypothetical protein
VTVPPRWLDTLIEDVMNGVEGHSLIGTFGYRYRSADDADDDDVWEVVLYPTPIELRGGDQHGAVIDPGFSLDLLALLALFDNVVAFQWTAHPFLPGDRAFPAVAIEGTVQGHGVSLQIQATAPDDEPPGMTFDVPPTQERH